MRKVLLVDDDVYIRQGMRNLIDWRALGFEIGGEAGNGMEALAWMQAHRPDVVITDIRMPVLDGLELVAKAAKECAFPVSFIIASGYEDFKYAQQAVRSGVRDYLLKPIDEDELVFALRGIETQRSGILPEREDEESSPEPPTGVIYDVKAYIEAHFREEISLKSIAALFYMNPVYLGQLFRRTFGLLFNEFLLCVRIAEAKKLLHSTNLLVYEIAEQVGFNTPNYFVAQFEKLERMTPSQYRSRQRQAPPGRSEEDERDPQ
ncbi:hypothetical protein B1A99_26415 [Cohnella sp. CIP 111063]|uniref:response regulator transcription factor n=1 Tax=unclassified Cohnella TaxID=2636738 RepID=UPI000B8C0371|nr:MULTISPECIES: response regulator [unclassified Cohnella]OXS54486.1 hypothetical protein B1A99_26415 [Cohnella sp. CIP 111063]PRX63988.1 two-component system response regulator YesN [Cohnella sp. SGD-V74]